MYNIAAFGIRRCGNHAIANWLIPHFKGIVKYYNNTHTGKNYIMPDYFMSDNNYTFRIDITDEKRSRSPRFRYNGDRPFSRLRENTNICAELHGVENCHLNDGDAINFYKNNDINTKILILRDPLNNLSSLMKHPGELIDLNIFAELWCEYAEEYLNTDSEMIKVNYNKWFKDIDYRKSLSIQLGQKWTDYGLQEMSLCGGGSSFSKLKHQGNTQKLKVLERWPEYKNNRKFRKLLNNKKLIELYRIIYQEDWPLSR